MLDRESMPLPSGIVNSDLFIVICHSVCVCVCVCVCRWKRMPKHIKICKHPDTKRFYVSDVTDFESVWVSLHARLYMGAIAVHTRHSLLVGPSELLPDQLTWYQFPWCGHNSACSLQGSGYTHTRKLQSSSSSPSSPIPFSPTTSLSHSTL